VALYKELGVKTRKVIRRGVEVFIEVVGLLPCAINNMFFNLAIGGLKVMTPMIPTTPLNIEIRMILTIPPINEIHIR
jgi:hypothetical protein